MSAQVIRYIETQISNGEFVESWTTILDFYKRRLVHQITEEFLRFFQSNVDSKLNFLDAFVNVIEDVSKRMNLTSLARLMVMVAAQLKNKNLDEAKKFLKSHISKLGEEKAPLIIAKSYLAKLFLYEKEIVTANELFCEISQALDTLSETSFAHLYYYDSILISYYLTQQTQNYYYTALKYYSIVDISGERIDDDKLNKAYTAALSSLLIPTVTNMGAMLFNKNISDHLTKYCPRILELIKVIDSGDMGLYKSFPDIDKIDDIITENLAVIEEKVVLMAILNLSYNCILENRDLTFQLVSEHTNIDIDKVEYFIIRAISIEIIKGRIDQVKQLVQLTFVKPKFLSESQIQSLKSKVDSWADKIRMVSTHLQELSLKVREDHGQQLIVP